MEKRCECGFTAEYKYNGKMYCDDCILKEFGVEENIVTYYHCNGEYLGNDECDGTDYVILNLDECIEKIEP